MCYQPWQGQCEKKCCVLQETSRRFLHFTVPRVVAVSPQMRLVEDNPASVSLLDIYKQGCARVGLEHDSPVLRYYERLATVQVKFLNIWTWLITEVKRNHRGGAVTLYSANKIKKCWRDVEVNVIMESNIWWGSSLFKLSVNAIQMIKLRRIMWTVCVICMQEAENLC